MTIGALAHSVAREPTSGPNPDFLTLIDCRKKIVDERGYSFKAGDFRFSVVS